MGHVARQDGQAVLLLVAAMVVALVGAVVLGGVARGIGKGGREQRAADLGALAGARAMRESYTRLFEPPSFAGKANSRHLEVGAYKRLGREAALGVACANGAHHVEVTFPDGDTFAPVRVRVTVRDAAESDAGGHRHEAAIQAQAEAELAPPGQLNLPLGGGDGEYQGPLPTGRASPCAPTWRWPSTAHQTVFLGTLALRVPLGREHRAGCRWAGLPQGRGKPAARGSRGRA